MAAHCLALVLKEVDARDLCVRKGVVQLLAPLVANPRRADQTRASVQLQYEASMCYWQLSFYKKAAEAMVRGSCCWEFCYLCYCMLGWLEMVVKLPSLIRPFTPQWTSIAFHRLCY